MEIKGTTVIMTGGGSGIGRATAVALASLGSSRVHIVDLNESGALETSSLVRAAGAEPEIHVLDVEDHAMVEAMKSAVGSS